MAEEREEEMKQFDLPVQYNLGIRECIEQIHYDATQKMDTLVFSAFRSLGYTRDWIFKNHSHITVDRIFNPAPFSEQVIYKLDDKPLFQVGQTTEISMENGIYKLLVNWEVKYFKKGETND